MIKVYRNDFVERGKLLVKIVDIEDSGKVKTYNGEIADTVEVIYEDEFLDIVKRSKYISKITNNSHLGEAVKAALGRIPARFSIESIIDKRIVIEIDHKQSKKDGKIYSNVVGHYRVSEVDPGELMNPEALHSEEMEAVMQEV